MTALHAQTRRGNDTYIFTSESVSEGHPDKVCDQISDAILDAYLREDPKSKVACETLCTKDRVVLSGETSSSRIIDVEPVVREVIKKIGYTNSGKGFDFNCEIQNYLHEQEKELMENTGAGDQGLMFGYACSQSKYLMPIPIEVAHQLLINLAHARKDGSIPGLLPDSKSQVSFVYAGRKPVALNTVVISTNHQPLTDRDFEDLKMNIIEQVVQPTIHSMGEDMLFDVSSPKIMINPLGKWEEGGPAADTGLTGRKIIVDTYGGWAQHGGGAFSGKDATKVDRSATYMARHIAKSVVASSLAEECLIQMSFVIGDTRPVSVMVDSFGSGVIPDSEIEALIKREFDLTVMGIIEYLGLREAIYGPTAAYGHFGFNTKDCSWEGIKKLN
nr:S-adenosylmethionine synthetase [Candidatus Cloacimonadota bacterium]